jgi:hypothetical protein
MDFGVSIDNEEEIQRKSWFLFLDTIAKIIQDSSLQSAEVLQFKRCKEKHTMQSKGIFSLELLLGETQQKHISTLKKLAQIKNEMTFLGLEFTGRTGLLRGQIEIPNGFLID